MLPGGSGNVCMIKRRVPGLDLYCTDPARHVTAAGSDIGDADRFMSGVRQFGYICIYICLLYTSDAADE